MMAARSKREDDALFGSRRRHQIKMALRPASRPGRRGMRGGADGSMDTFRVTRVALCDVALRQFVSGINGPTVQQASALVSPHTGQAAVVLELGGRPANVTET